MLDTSHRLFPTSFPVINRLRVETLQVNLGLRCNQSCVHCHVNAGPKRSEEMERPTVDLVLELLRARELGALDLTGGAPELNPHFRYLVKQASGAGVHVIDRCNLTILEQPGQEDLAGFLADQRVEVVASLPCYLEDNVDAQRGKGVFEASISGLRRLNALGYGNADKGLVLNLVYNPQGPVLPPPQCALEADYRRQLDERFGIRFNRLLTLSNMPIRRFGSALSSKGMLDDYLELLRRSHRPENLDQVMCRRLLSVDWRGYVYDCDFNQMLDMAIRNENGGRLHISDLMHQDLSGRQIRVGEHCYGCTAGQGSSCGGALEG